MPRLTRHSANIGRRTNKAKTQHGVRTNETQQRRERRLSVAREHIAALRESQTEDQRAAQQTEGRVTRANARAARHRHPQNVVADNANRRVIRQARIADYERAAFQYDPSLDYSDASSFYVNIAKR